jgi:hypothetical protein
MSSHRYKNTSNLVDPDPERYLTATLLPILFPSVKVLQSRSELSPLRRLSTARQAAVPTDRQTDGRRRNFQTRSCNRRCSGKAMSIAQLCVCVYSLRYPACHVASCSLSAVQYFSTLSHNRKEFRRNINEHKMCASSFSTTFVPNIFRYKKN